MKTDMSHLLLVGALGVAIFASGIFVILQSSSMPNQPNASATFPGENGKITFTSDGSSNPRSLMNAEWSNGQIDKSRSQEEGPIIAQIQEPGEPML